MYMKCMMKYYDKMCCISKTTRYISHKIYIIRYEMTSVVKEDFDHIAQAPVIMLHMRWVSATCDRSNQQNCHTGGDCRCSWNKEKILNFCDNSLIIQVICWLGLPNCEDLFSLFLFSHHNTHNILFIDFGALMDKTSNVLLRWAFLIIAAD